MNPITSDFLYTYNSVLHLLQLRHLKMVLSLYANVIEYLEFARTKELKRIYIHAPSGSNHDPL